MKKIISFLLSAVFCVALFSFDVSAAGAEKKVYDPENLLSEMMYDSVTEGLVKISEEYSVDAVAIVVDSIEKQGFEDEQALFDDYIGRYKIGIDGDAVLYLVEEDTKSQYICPLGIACNIFTDEVIESIKSNSQANLDLGGAAGCIMLFSWDADAYISEFLIAEGIIDDPFSTPDIDVPDIPDSSIFPDIPEVPSYAEGEYDDSLPRVVDEVGLLSEGEISQLEKEMRGILEEYGFDCSVVVVDSYYPEAVTIMGYADNYYDYGGYGVGPEADGIMFVVAMDTREWWLTTCGYGMIALNDYGLEWIEDEVIGMLSEGDYYGCFDRYAKIVDIFVKEAKENKPYSSTHRYVTAGHIWKSSKVALIAGAVISVIITAIVAGVLKSKMKTVKRRPFAREYVRDNSFVVTRSTDTFMYTRTTRTARSSGGSGGGGGHRSSSGRSHGGRGGRF